MDPHLLRTFTVVVRCASFSAAAQELGYTQSAVSQHVAALEADLGTRLLLRRPVAPTAAGERLLEHAGPILLRLAAARADIARIDDPEPTQLRLGATPLAASAAAQTVDGARRSRPGRSISVRVTGRAALPQQVAAGELDLGLLDGVVAPSDPLPLHDVGPLAVSVVSEEPAVVALPLDHPLAGRDRLRLGDLVDARWIDAPDVAAPLPRLRAAAGVDGFRPSLSYDGVDVLGLLAFVAAGHGLAVLPAGLVATATGLVGVPIGEPHLVYRVERLRLR